MRKTISLIMAIIMLCSCLIITGSVFAADETETAYSFSKLTNPGTVSGMPDGINTNEEDFPANRYNSYAWAMEELNGYLYVGTNRNLYGSAMSAVAKQMAAMTGQSYEEVSEKLVGLANIITHGDVPAYTEMEDEDWIPQIIKIDVNTGNTKVIYQPDTEGIDPKTEVCSFRSVIKYNNKLYFGSLGTTRLQIVSIDNEDKANVVYSVSAKGSSLRACAIWDNTIVFGGLDNSLTPAEDSEYAGMKPMVIRAMNPEDETDWSTIIADYRDFVPYADETIYAEAGGTVWDLVAYNNKLYAVLASDDGFVMFAGVKATAEQVEAGEANNYGYIWTPVIGKGGRYNPGMADTELGLNHGEGDVLGNIDSTATPYVYNGKLYIGTFDNATNILLSTFTRVLARVNDIEKGPSLSAIYQEIYNVVNNPQKLYCMDENENILPVENLNEQLVGTTNDYIWRMREFNGKLYLTTFDSATLWGYFAGLGADFIMPPTVVDEANSLSVQLATATKKFAYATDSDEVTDSDDVSDSGEITDPTNDYGAVAALGKIAYEYSLLVGGYLNEEIGIEELVMGLEKLQAELDAVYAMTDNEYIIGLADKMQLLMNAADIKGLKMYMEISEVICKNTKGFSLFVSEDGEKFTEVINDGLNDKYNYGGRTLAECNGELYVGTANPFYGAQVWRVTENTTPVKKGDINGDGAVNTGDAVMILKYAAEMVTLTAKQLEIGDVSFDGIVNTGDAVLVLKYSANMIDGFEPQE